MNVTRHFPAEPIAQYVQSIEFIQGNTIGTGLPKSAMSLIFNLQDGFRLYDSTDFETYDIYDKYWLAGFQLTPRHTQSYGQSKMMIIQFKTLGAYAFFNESLLHFKNGFITLDLIHKELAEVTWSKLKETNTVDQKFSIIEQYLHILLKNRKSLNSMTINRLYAALSLDNSVSVKDMCTHLNVSRKHLNTLFNQYIGVSPKAYLKLKRFRKTLHTLAKKDYHSLSSLTYEMDYFDQSHFIKDFQQLSGLTPQAYIKLLWSCPSMSTVPHYIPTLRR